MKIYEVFRRFIATLKIVMKLNFVLAYIKYYTTMLNGYFYFFNNPMIFKVYETEKENDRFLHASYTNSET